MLSTTAGRDLSAPTQERLRVLLGFATMAELIDFLESAYIRSAFGEFAHDYLEEHYTTYSRPDFNEVAESLGAYRALGTTSPAWDRYNADNPDKSNWTVKHHAGRFMVQAYVLAQRADSSRGGVDEPEAANVLMQLWELLAFLIRRWMNQNA
ncbi:hypothetical protein GE09DRAFT_1224457 [Coniochaeta sp. 2T2.1]|nr:hypothetical protein GE09DRAFT_1224457 [Coniochaeta sp. 2T2.1]